MAEQLRMMSVHAHPDDESSKGAATIARYVADGHEVMVVTCTGGERGSILNVSFNAADVVGLEVSGVEVAGTEVSGVEVSGVEVSGVEMSGVEMPGADMAGADTAGRPLDITAIRRVEMARAAQILGVAHRWLGYVDSGLPEGDPMPPLPAECFAVVPLEGPTRDLVALIREFRPHVMVTYDENGGYPHPDHIRCHEVSVAAFDAAGDPDRFPEVGAPWQPLKLYYSHGFSRKRMQLFHDALLAAGEQSPFGEWLDTWDSSRPDVLERVTTWVECGEYFEVRDDALRAHATQIDPDSRWFAVPHALQRELWPTEEYELARSLVDTTLPEDDLFSGVRERVSA